jgi:pSer/pThr/pTyr-binding forkhead associated (FHA) protein
VGLFDAPRFSTLLRVFEQRARNMGQEPTAPGTGVRLRVLTGKHAGTELRVPTPRFLIGRGDDCQLRMNSQLVSRHHCVLLVRDRQVSLQDLESRNGTFVNAERIQGERPLKPGDKVKIGELTFEVQMAGPASAKRPKLLDAKDAAMRILEDAQGDDSDVVDWLHDDKSAPPSDTLKMTVSETHIGTTSASASGSETANGDAASRSHIRKMSGPPPQTKDSHEAAADLLRKYLKSR